MLSAGCTTCTRCAAPGYASFLEQGDEIRHLPEVHTASDPMMPNISNHYFARAPGPPTKRDSEMNYAQTGRKLMGQKCCWSRIVEESGSALRPCATGSTGSRRQTAWRHCAATARVAARACGGCQPARRQEGELLPASRRPRRPVVSGLVSDRAWMAEAMGVEQGGLVRHFQDAAANPLPWQEVAEGPAQEVVHRRFDLCDCCRCRRTTSMTTAPTSPPGC